MTAASTRLAVHHQLHGLQPVLPVADVAASAHYFVEVLGFELDLLHGEPPAHGRVKTGDGSHGQPIYLHLGLAAAPIVPSGELRLHAGHALDALHDACVARGAAVAMPPRTQPWGLREFVLTTPDGHRLRFCAEA